MPKLSHGAKKLQTSMRSILRHLFTNYNTFSPTDGSVHFNYYILDYVQKDGNVEDFLDTLVSCLRSDWLEAFSTQSAWENIIETAKELQVTQQNSDDPLRTAEGVIYFGLFSGLPDEDTDTEDETEGAEEAGAVPKDKTAQGLRPLAGYGGETVAWSSRGKQHYANVQDPYRKSASPWCKIAHQYNDSIWYIIGITSWLTDLHLGELLAIIQYTLESAVLVLHNVLQKPAKIGHRMYSLTISSFVAEYQGLYTFPVVPYLQPLDGTWPFAESDRWGHWRRKASSALEPIASTEYVEG